MKLPVKADVDAKLGDSLFRRAAATWARSPSIWLVHLG